MALSSLSYASCAGCCISCVCKATLFPVTTVVEEWLPDSVCIDKDGLAVSG